MNSFTSRNENSMSQEGISSLERLARCVKRILHDVLHIQAIDVGEVVPQVSGI